MVGARGTRGLSLRFRGDGAEDPRAQRPAHLAEQQAHSASGSVDQHRHPRLHPEGGADEVVRGHALEERGGGLGGRHALGQPDQLRRRPHGLLRVAAQLHDPADPVPGRQVRNAGPHGFHDAGAFHPGGERGGDRVEPGAVVGVDEVDSGRFDPDEGVFGTGRGLGDGAEGHHLGSAGLLDADGSGHENPFGRRILQFPE